MERNSRKIRVGVVVSAKMDKTVVVRVERTMAHPEYQKVIKRSKRYYAHTDNKLEEGTKVRIMETRPLSKTKCWRVLEVVGEKK